MIVALTLLLLVLVPLGDLLATVFFASLFLRSQRHQPPRVPDTVARRPRLWGGPILLGGRSWLLGLMTLAWAIITPVCALVGFLGGRRLLGLPPLPEGAELLAIAAIALGLIPIAFAVAFHLTRRRRAGSPPPFSEAD